MKKIKKILLIFTLIFTLSANTFTFSYSIGPNKLTSSSSQTKNDKESIRNTPAINIGWEQSSVNITKLSNILGESAIDVMVVESLAYVAVGYGGMRIINISDPIVPKKIGQLNEDVDGFSYQIYVSGSYAYVADGNDGLEIIDISDPTNPVEVGQFNDYAESWFYYNIFDIHATDVYISGSIAYLTDWYEGLEILDISDPTNPVEIGHAICDKQSYDLCISGSLAYVAEFYDGLTIIDISNPRNPINMGKFDVEGETYSVFVSGSYAYLANSDYGLIILDISNPFTPVEVGNFYDGGSLRDVYVSVSYAYLADDNDGLKIIDISDPTNPVKLWQFIDEGSVWGVDVVGNYVYVADLFDGLVIYYFEGVDRKFSISGYNRILLLSSMSGISVILIMKKRKKYVNR